MTNREQINNMSNIELSSIILKIGYQHFGCKYMCKGCNGDVCTNNIVKWLESEVEVGNDK